ncbi:MAG: TonB-dependent receptor [Proteobacteria bacterium]|nr:TonB-dependent receptor [Pseudomonadota bacterium]
MNRIETKLSKLAVLMASASVLSLPAHAEDVPTTVLDTVVVSAPLREKVSQSARPATVLTAEVLATQAGNTIGGTLAKEPGMSNQSFGPGVGSPVIRGQAGPRVRVLQNGIGVNDASTLSPDHANGVEPMLAERIEILRGPATLLYGSGAIGGVVNVIDNRIPSMDPDKLLGGAFEQRYNSVSDENASVLKLEGGKGIVAYHLDGFYREQGNMHIGGAAIDEPAARASDPGLEGIHPLQNSYGVINNTNARGKGGTVGVSLVGDPGFAGVAVNHLENNYGIPPDGTGNPPVRIELRQTKYNFQGEWKEPFTLAEAMRMKFGYTDYQHTEIPGGIPGTTFTNKAYESRLELVHKPLGPLKGAWGFQSVNSDFQAVGLETLVPHSNIDTYGLFAVESFDIGKVTFDFGLRGEYQATSPQDLGFISRNYTLISGSSSALWNINERHQLSLAFTQSQRAPQIQELYSKGVHDATHSYELGDANLNKEISYNLDLGYRFNTDWVKAEVNLFQNWVSNYIYQQRTGEVFNEESESIEDFCTTSGACLPVVQSRQGDATFKGFESKLVFPLMENHYGLVDLSLFGDYTRGEFVSGYDVPRMPPLRYGFALDYAKSAWSANLRLTRAEPQNHPGQFDTDTPGYVLLGVGAQYEVKNFHQANLLLFARGSNLLNENIRNSTSYLRNFAPEPGRGAEIGIRMSY